MGGPVAQTAADKTPSSSDFTALPSSRSVSRAAVMGWRGAPSASADSPWVSRSGGVARQNLLKTWLGFEIEQGH